MTALSEREQRLVAVALLLALLALGWVGVASPVLTAFSDLAARRDRAEDQLARDTRTLAAAPRIRLAWAGAKARATAVALAGPHPAGLARALVDEAIRSEGPSLVVGAIGEDATAKGRTRLTVELRGSQPAITDLIRRLENNRPAARITDVVLSGPDEGPQDGVGAVRARLGLEYLDAPSI